MPRINLIEPYEVVNGGIFRSGPTSSRFDAHLLVSHIADALERHVVPCICPEFYEELVASKNDAAYGNLNPKAGALVEFFPSNPAFERLWIQGGLYEFCSWAVAYEAAPFIGLQFGSNGLFLIENEFGQSAGVGGIKFMQDTIMDRLAVKCKRLKEFLAKNADDYPTYQNICLGGCGNHTEEKGMSDWGLHIY